MLALPGAAQSAAAGEGRAGIILASGMLLSVAPLASAVDQRREA
jgi:hypothetical protein